MSLTNYQVSRIIAKRKALDNVKSPSPEGLNKSEFRKGIETANNQIDEWETLDSNIESKKKAELKFHQVNEYMFKTTSNNTYSYWLGLSCGFGKYVYSGSKFKI